MGFGEASRAVEDEVDEVAWTDARPTKARSVRAWKPTRRLRIPMAAKAGEAMDFLLFTASVD